MYVNSINSRSGSGHEDDETAVPLVVMAVGPHPPNIGLIPHPGFPRQLYGGTAELGRSGGQLDFILYIITKKMSLGLLF